MVVRARSVKAELSDVEGLAYKLEERQQNILELKKSLKMKVKVVYTMFVRVYYTLVSIAQIVLLLCALITPHWKEL